MPPNPSVAIIILNWNNWQDTLECLESLKSNAYPNYSILVVDNKSDNDSYARIEEWIAKYGNIGLIQTNSNLGFAGGCNVGIKRGLKKGADYILLLNNDTIVEPHFLQRLVNTAEAKPDAGIVSGKILYNHNKKIWYRGGRISWLRGGGYHFCKGSTSKDECDKPPFEVNFVSGCLMLIKRELFEESGLMDESYFLYNEDVEYCVRASKLNFKMLVDPNAIIYHKENSTFGGWKPYHIYYLIRNKLIFMKKYAPSSLVLFTFYFIVATMGAILFTNWSLRKRPDLVRAFILAIRDFHNGLSGKSRKYT